MGAGGGSRKTNVSIEAFACLRDGPQMLLWIIRIFDLFLPFFSASFPLYHPPSPSPHPSSPASSIALMRFPIRLPASCASSLASSLSNQSATSDSGRFLAFGNPYSFGIAKLGVLPARQHSCDTSHTYHHLNKSETVSPQYLLCPSSSSPHADHGRPKKSGGSAVPLSQIEKSVTHLLVATKQLLETLTQWSRGNATDTQVSDVYVRLGYEFNMACRAFTAINVDTSDLGTCPSCSGTSSSRP